ncbi:hypothetical protein AVEN_75241-1 [Araneus ventricosus]|uniref:Uncharacterized protein n=1 Tax=Araneus ventricosus TaxID=182803 RepID=A0A4Y2P9Z1_ARAVE|nr:hypothetical protein AVEN_75241-1 [Araneus ventricosus]
MLPKYHIYRWSRRDREAPFLNPKLKVAVPKLPSTQHFMAKMYIDFEIAESVSSICDVTKLFTCYRKRASSFAAKNLQYREIHSAQHADRFSSQIKISASQIANCRKYWAQPPPSDWCQLTFVPERGNLVPKQNCIGDKLALF